MKTVLIAEVGVNHNGDAVLAKEMIAAAAEAGASCVKFETIFADELVTKYARRAAYQMENDVGGGEYQLEMLRKFELDYETHRELADCCERLGVEFMSTPFGLRAVALLERLGVERYKIPSGEITNYPYLKRIGQTGKPVFLSTGMSVLDEIFAALRVLRDSGSGPITLLHCTTQYPTPFEDANLRAMHTMERAFNLPVGYSDHTPGIEVAIAAVALGAVAIEKHFTMDKNMEGPDHKASITPDELKSLANAIHHVEKALGNGEKKPAASELQNMDIARKSIVAAVPIKQGEVFTEENITTKRPGSGISPMRYEEILGQVAVRNFTEDELIVL